MVDHSKSADHVFRNGNDDLLLRIIPDYMNKIPQLLAETRFENIGLSRNMQIIDLLSQLVDPLQFIFFGETYFHFHPLPPGYESQNLSP